MHLGLVLDATGRSEALGDVIRAQLPLPEGSWQLHHDYAGMLLDGGAKSEEVAALIAPIPRDWPSELMSGLRERVTVQRIIETAPAARIDIAKAIFAKGYSLEQVAIAACRSREPAVYAVMRTALPDHTDALDNALFACAIQYRRADSLAVALPLIKDVNMPINLLWQDPAVCGAAARNDDRSLALLMKAGADIQKPCLNGGTPRQILTAAVARGDVEAEAALAGLDGGAASR
jgi:hypothetical protein